jgi:pyridoxamine 5'-phosphate oxidase
MKNTSNYSSLRKNYQSSQLLEDELPENPISLFNQWFDEVSTKGGVAETNAMTLSTTNSNGAPQSRVVLLKHIDHGNFVFFTNYKSTKGLAISQNPQVCLSFYWPNLERQVIITGIAESIDEFASDAYFQERPRGSQIGAHVSDQSSPIHSREFLDNKLAELESFYKNKPIPRPKHWGGYKVIPKTIEFWQGRPNRLHDRIFFLLNNKDQWTFKRLSP